MDLVRTSHLSVFEHEQLLVTQTGSATSLSVAEAESLMHLAETRPGFCEWGLSTVRFAQYCGVVNLGLRMLEVLPKVESTSEPSHSRGVLFRLLRASGAYPGIAVVPASQHLTNAPLFEIFISHFFDAVTTVVRGGLLRQYAEHEEDLRVMRGRIQLVRQFGVHFDRPDLIASHFDEHTANNEWNRLVKAALRTTRPWIVSGELHRRWIELMAAFEEVSDIFPVSADLDCLIFDRRAARYRPVMDWVRWILALLSPALRAGESRAPSFLFDMNAVFEQAVTNLLRRHLTGTGSGFEVQAQASDRYLARIGCASGSRSFGLRPDVVVQQKQEIRLVADAKWKRVHVGRSGYMKPDGTDMYQMHAYAATYGVERLCLVYPAHEGSRAGKPTEFVLPATGGRHPRVTVVCIDVNHDDLPAISGADVFLFT